MRWNWPSRRSSIGIRGSRGDVTEVVAQSENFLIPHWVSPVIKNVTGINFNEEVSRTNLEQKKILLIQNSFWSDGGLSAFLDLGSKTPPVFIFEKKMSNNKIYDQNIRFLLRQKNEKASKVTTIAFLFYLTIFDGNPKARVWETTSAHCDIHLKS